MDEFQLFSPELTYNSSILYNINVNKVGIVAFLKVCYLEKNSDLRSALRSKIKGFSVTFGMIHFTYQAPGVHKQDGIHLFRNL